MMLRGEDGDPLKLRKYMGVDPAVSMSGKGDRFVISVVGVSDDNRDWETDRKSTRLNSSHSAKSRMPSSA